MEIIERIDHWGKVTPDHAAFISGGRTLSYGELRRRSDALAAHLAGSLPEEAAVVVLGHKEPELLVAYLGAIKSGRAYVPVDTAMPAQRIERIVAASGAPLVLTPEKVALLSDGDAPAPPWRMSTDDHYYIMFTSGSTGNRKRGADYLLVPTRKELSAVDSWGSTSFVEEPEVIFWNVVPYSFDVSLMDTYPAALVTWRDGDQRPRKALIANPRQLYEHLAASAVSTWVSTPSFAQMCLVEPTFNEGMLPQLKRFLFCGETLCRKSRWQLRGAIHGSGGVEHVRPDRGDGGDDLGPNHARDYQSILSAADRYAMPGSRVLVTVEQQDELPAG